MFGLERFFNKDRTSKREIAEHYANLTKDKETANAKHEPWVGILDVAVDYNNLDSGSFELDWNDIFIAKLTKAGYVGKEDSDLVDQWFGDVCRNIVMETHEQEIADRHPVQSRKIANNRREFK